MRTKLLVGLTVLVWVLLACASGEDPAAVSDDTTGNTSAPIATSISSTTSTFSTSTLLQDSPTATPIDLADLEGRILFGRAGGQWGDATIFTANADGSEDERIGGLLEDYQTEICCPRWSPDGTEIAFGFFDELPGTGIVEPDGSNLQVLFHSSGAFRGGCNVWSRATDRMACEGGMGDPGPPPVAIPDSYGVYTVSAVDGDDVRPVHTEEFDPGYVVAPLDFSPDGSQLVFLGEPIGPRDSRIYPGSPLGSLYVANVDGTDLHRITPDGVHAWSQARWSPDGQWIMFGGVGEGDPLWAVRPDGADFHIVYQPEGGQAGVLPTWSPDGQFILFALNPPNVLEVLTVAPPNKLCVIRADGTDLTCIIDTPDHKVWPDWAAP